MTQPATQVDERGTEDLRTGVRALAKEWFEESGARPLVDPWLRGFEPSFSKRLSDKGFIGITWPTQYGGGARSNAARLAVTEELLRTGAPSAAHWISERQIGPSILRHGSDALKEEILPGIVSVDKIFCLGMSEEQAGSDLAAVRTRAQKVDGGWLLSGRKMWTGYAHKATHAYVLARTSDAARKHEGLSEFIVDMGEGIGVTPILNMAGEHRFNQVDFSEAFVPDGRLLGTEGNGWRQVVDQLSFERGGAERYLSSYLLFTELLRRLRQTGAELQEMVGLLVQRLAILRHLAFQTAASLDRGEAPIRQAAALKLIGNQFEVDVLESFRKVLRPEDMARTSNYSIGVQSAPGFELRGGSVEVLLSIIAKEEARA